MPNSNPTQTYRWVPDHKSGTLMQLATNRKHATGNHMMRPNVYFDTICKAGRFKSFSHETPGLMNYVIDSCLVHVDDDTLLFNEHLIHAQTWQTLFCQHSDNIL